MPSCPACSFPPPNQHQQHPHSTHYLTLLHSKKSTPSIRKRKPNITRESTQEVGSRRGREREEVRKGSSQVEGKAATSAEEVNKLAPLSFPLLPLAPPAISLQIAACVVLAQ
jgi:hypothetical protein